MALYVTLPGYQGLYFQGVAENIKTEDFAFEAMKYNSDMVILAFTTGSYSPSHWELHINALVNNSGRFSNTRESVSPPPE